MCRRYKQYCNLHSAILMIAIKIVEIKVIYVNGVCMHENEAAKINP